MYEEILGALLYTHVSPINTSVQYEMLYTIKVGIPLTQNKILNLCIHLKNKDYIKTKSS